MVNNYFDINVETTFEWTPVNNGESYTSRYRGFDMLSIINEDDEIGGFSVYAGYYNEMEEFTPVLRIGIFKNVEDSIPYSVILIDNVSELVMKGIIESVGSLIELKNYNPSTEIVTTKSMKI